MHDVSKCDGAVLLVHAVQRDAVVPAVTHGEVPTAGVHANLRGMRRRFPDALRRDRRLALLALGQRRQALSQSKHSPGILAPILAQRALTRVVNAHVHVHVARLGPLVWDVNTTHGNRRVQFVDEVGTFDRRVKEEMPRAFTGG